MRICFIAPSGYGKTTAVNILKGLGYDVENIKIAQPLYELQKYFYDFIGCDIKGEQDGELLQFLGLKIRKENPDFLLENFRKRLIRGKAEIVVNDDCRPPDFEFLKEHNFKFVSIKGFRRTRKDHTEGDAKSKIEWQNTIECEFCVENLSTMQIYQENLIKLMKQIEDSEGKNER